MEDQYLASIDTGR